MSHVLGFSFCRVQFHFLRICRHPSHFLLKENYLLQEKKKGEWYKSALWQVPHFFCFFSVRDPSIVIIGTFPPASASGVQCVCNPPCEHAVQSLTPKALISCCEIWLWDPGRRQTFWTHFHQSNVQLLTRQQKGNNVTPPKADPLWKLSLKFQL